MNIGALIGPLISFSHRGLTLSLFSAPCSYHHALALIRFYCQCNWLSSALFTPEQASNLSTHSMKSTLLAAVGQLNLSLESRAKQGHRKKSVQLYSRDDAWPSLFLRRDILVDISDSPLCHFGSLPWGFLKESNVRNE